MISPNDIKVTKYDLTLFTTLLVVTNIVNNQLFKANLFDEQWKNIAVATLLGVALHGLITNQISSVVNNQLNLHKSSLALVIYDLVKFGTIFVSIRVITSLLEDKKIEFDKVWMLETGGIIAGYGLYSIAIGPIMPPTNKVIQPLFNDSIKLSMGALAGKFALGADITNDKVLQFSGVLLSLIIFHLFTKKIVELPESCKPCKQQEGDKNEEDKH